VEDKINGGYTGKYIHYLMLMSTQWHFSVLSFSGSSLGCIVFKLFLTAIMWCINDVTFIWILSSIMCFSIASLSQFIPAPKGIWEPSTIFVVYMNLAVLKPWQYSLLVQITHMDKLGENEREIWRSVLLAEGWDMVCIAI
jgi:hypothetical protein